jgi:moderate conductance mechanosensitive channel
MLEWFLHTGIRILIIIVIALVLFFICRFLIPSVVKRIITRGMLREDQTEIDKRTSTLSSILVTITGIVIAILAILTILPEFGINILTLITGLGIGGLAFAFAAQNLVRDFITGFFILLEDQYRIGDVVNLAGIEGTVEGLGLRRTILRDLDGVVHSIPNGKVEISSNMTKKFARVNLDIAVGYNEKLERAMEVINAVCKEMAEDPKWKPDLITTPAVVRVNKLGDSGIDIKVMGDTKPSRQWDVMGELRLRIKNSFDREGIEYPMAETKVFFGNAPVAPNKN